MKAWVLHGPDRLSLEERPIPAPGGGEVLVEVRAAGICGSDISRIFETGAHVHPLIPGHEFSGVVVGGPEEALLGKRVGVFPLIPCGRCPQCEKRQYELCRSYQYLGSRRDGGFAEYAAVPRWNLIELPEGVTLELAAMLEPLSVAIHAIRRAGTTAADSAAVIGLGTIGLLAAGALRAMGVERLAVLGNKPFQRQMARRLGVPPECYYEDPACLPECGVVLECVGGLAILLGFLAGTLLFSSPGEGARAILAGAVLMAALGAAEPGGRVVTVGNPAGEMRLSREDYWKILRKQLTVLGTWNSSFTHSPEDDWHTALRLLEGNAPLFEQIITHRLPLDALAEGLNVMRNRTEPSAKIMVLGPRETEPSVQLD